MVTDLRIEGSTHVIPAGVRKTIQSLKEIVGNHSDSDIYVTLKENNMDPTETVDKLLNQDPFHEVKRKRDKKKAVTVPNGPTPVEPRMLKVSTTMEPRKITVHFGQGMKHNIYPDRNVRRGVYSQNPLPGISREFRVVRDNRTNQNVDKEPKPPSVQSSVSTDEPVILKVSEKSSAGTSGNQRPQIGRHSTQYSNGTTDLNARQAADANSSRSNRRNSTEETRSLVPNSSVRMQPMKPNDTQLHSTTSSNSSVVGLYSSSSDPVHVPSLDSRPAANVGAIKREVRVVGVRRQSPENFANLSSSQSTSLPNSQLGRDGPSSRESFRSFTAPSKSDQPSIESTTPRSFLSNQYRSRSQQQHVGHQKAPQPSKEWKPKSSQKPSSTGPGVIGTPTKSVSPAADNHKELDAEVAQMKDKVSRVNIPENQNVIIAAHIQVSETDRSRLTFGSLGTDFGSSWSSGLQAVGGEELCIEPLASLSVSAPESSSDDTSDSKQVDSTEERAGNSGTNSPASGPAYEHHLADRKDSSSPQVLDSYADIGLVRNSSPSYTPTDSQQQQHPPELPSFSAYDLQTGYDIPYFRPTFDENMRGQGLASPQEALSSYSANSIPASTIAMIQQQQATMAQMYPQVHFTNLMPYRQFVSPVYVPPMAMPGYSGNPAYPHPSNGSSYVLMPGGTSHVTASGFKYGIQQFKPVPAGSPTGFGNFTSPTGYAINAPGVVGGAIEDSSRLKYKDGNLYVPNPQAETSEIWMNPRDLQSASYYNMPAQTPHAAYLPSHNGHASFNVAAAAAAQSSHMQFPGLYHPPPQPAAIANPHHLGPTMGGNVGVGVAAAAPGAQVGAYQQPQLGHLNWTGNF